MKKREILAAIDFAREIPKPKGSGRLIVTVEIRPDQIWHFAGGQAWCLDQVHQSKILSIKPRRRGRR